MPKPADWLARAEANFTMARTSRVRTPTGRASAVLDGVEACFRALFALSGLRAAPEVGIMKKAAALRAGSLLPLGDTEFDEAIVRLEEVSRGLNMTAHVTAGDFEQAYKDAHRLLEATREALQPSFPMTQGLRCLRKSESFLAQSKDEDREPLDAKCGRVTYVLTAVNAPVDGVRAAQGIFRRLEGLRLQDAWPGASPELLEQLDRMDRLEGEHYFGQARRPLTPEEFEEIREDGAFILERAVGAMEAIADMTAPAPQPS